MNTVHVFCFVLECGITFYTRLCTLAHVKTCGEYKRCKVCLKKARKDKFDEDGVHKTCGMTYCKTCGKFMTLPHEFCYVQPFKFKNADYYDVKATALK